MVAMPITQTSKLIRLNSESMFFVAIYYSVN